MPNETGHQPLKDRSHRDRYLKRRRVKGNIGVTPISPTPRASCAAARSSRAKAPPPVQSGREQQQHGPVHSVPRLSTDPVGAATRRFGRLVRHPLPGNMIC